MSKVSWTPLVERQPITVRESPEIPVSRFFIFLPTNLGVCGIERVRILHACRMSQTDDDDKKLIIFSNKNKDFDQKLIFLPNLNNS